MASTSQLNASTPVALSPDFAHSATYLLRASLALDEEGSAMHNSIKAALAFHLALMTDHHHKIEISSNVAREDARVTNALLNASKLLPFPMMTTMLTTLRRRLLNMTSFADARHAASLRGRSKTRRPKTPSRLLWTLYLSIAVFSIELMSRIRRVSSYYGVPNTSPGLNDALCCGRVA